MTLFHNKWLLLLFNFTLILIIFFLKSPSYDLFHFINSLFYVGSVYFFAGLLLMVIKGKFFDGITYSFRRFFHKSSKQPDYLDEWEVKPLPSEKVNPDLLKVCLFQGSIIFVIMGILIYVYYSF
ncbi:MAG: DUF3899 domain-containing protein [Bacillaceae bacterium]|nr:DUF3899 domain-containing protein [Bacillaceae bacterium]